MADYELFALTGLPFDPPEKAPKKVKEAIEKKLKEFGTALGNESQQLKRDEFNGAITFLKACLGEGDASQSIFDDGKLNAHYTKLAETRTKNEMDILKAMVDFQKQLGAHIITNGTVRTHVRKTKLSKENVEKIYQEAGFTISTVDPNKAYPKFPTNADKIYDELKVLRGMKDPNPQGHDLTMCTDLYSFTAYLSSDPGSEAKSPSEFKGKTTPKLKGILDTFSRTLSHRDDPLGKLLASLASAGKSYVFNTDDSRAAYEKHLLYRSPQMSKIFTVLHTVPDAEKYDPKFAESCIKQISDVFGEYDVALAIYNKEAGIKDEPYIPEKAVFHVKCSHCQNISEFADANDAQKVNKCSHCGKVLYKACNKCKELILASLDKCPECGFVFASLAMFAKFFTAAELALRKSDFEQARNHLFQAQSADPSEKTRLAELESRISAEEKKYEVPVYDLRKLIADKKFQRASEVLADTIGKFPKLNVSVFDSQISNVLDNVRSLFAKSKKLPTAKQADTCLEILDECADFKPAIDFLRATPPEACKSFSVGLDTVRGNANLSWARSPEHGVTYRVIRKQGKDIPVNEMDGEILLDNTTDTSYRDKGVQPGKYYSYAVFAIRFGVFSSSVGKNIVLIADVKDACCQQLDTTIRLTWNNPKNSTGVSIERTAAGITTTLTKCTGSSYEDKDVKYGVAYTYRLCANYNGLMPSRGIELVITPMVKIDSFTIREEQIKRNTYRVYWDIKRNGIDLRVLVNEKQSHELKSDAHFCELVLPPECFHTITVLAYSGGIWLRSSNSLKVNTYTPCTIDKASSQFTEKPIAGLSESACNIELRLKIAAPIPNSVVGFYYAVRSKAILSESAPWADKEEIDIKPDIQRVEFKSYQSSGEIVCSETARDESSYYVSLFTIHSSSETEIVSDPAKCRFDRPLIANIFWKVSKSVFGGYKLMMEISANRSFDRIPALELYACEGGQLLLTQNDPKGSRIYEIPETNEKVPSKKYKNTFNFNTDTTLKGLKLFLFEAVAVPNENFTLRWMKGFSGKV